MRRFSRTPHTAVVLARPMRTPYLPNLHGCGQRRCPAVRVCPRPQSFGSLKPLLHPTLMSAACARPERRRYAAMPLGVKPRSVLPKSSVLLAFRNVWRTVAAISRRHRRRRHCGLSLLDKPIDMGTTRK